MNRKQVVFCFFVVSAQVPFYTPPVYSRVLLFCSLDLIFFIIYGLMKISISTDISTDILVLEFYEYIIDISMDIDRSKIKL